ncbi:MBL fold metallo-hydrolase [Novosphingobium terrae]|uniref:MBL fold metallo-hydrolase n=1 Tax=Novosphingobium terrae TaxID=2726189 RepID=UPI00197ED560|nr:3',5'-cyclic-nucleotide phosphodiesterase [Novosphingobium terrae]
MKRFLTSLALLACAPGVAHAQTAPGGLEIVALGVRGGIVDGDLTSFLIHPTGDPRALTCDAGTLGQGLLVAQKRGTLSGESAGRALGQDIKAYLVTHAHLDHVAGLLIAATDYPGKTVYALPSTNAVLSGDYLNWRAWPNFADRGPAPRLGSLHLRDMAPGVAEAVEGTAMRATAYPLEHGGVTSTAFLIEAGQTAALCLGDHGPDSPGHDELHSLWQAAAPLLREGRLKAIITEASYPDPREDKQLFGHMTPSRLIASLRDLAALAGGPEALRGVTVIVDHIKYLPGEEEATRRLITRQLAQASDLPVRFILPRQGDRFVVRP